MMKKDNVMMSMFLVFSDVVKALETLRRYIESLENVSKEVFKYFTGNWTVLNYKSLKKLWSKKP